MPAASRHFIAFARFRRLLAAGTAMLVVLLAAFAVSPELHHWLHDDAGTETDGCAVMLFSNGLSAPPAPLVVVPPAPAPTLTHERPASEIFLVRARYLWQPERGPPLES